jgi:hypothetical protein
VTGDTTSQPASGIKLPTRPTSLHTWTVVLADRSWTGIDRLVGERAIWRDLPYPTGIGWVVTRGLLVAMLLTFESTNLNDVLYYAGNMFQISPATPVAAVLREYPTPVVGLLALPMLFAVGKIGLYVTAFVVLMLVLDGAYTWLLRRRSGTRPGAAVTLWLIAGPALGPIALSRFDLVSGVLAGGAVLVVATRPRWAGVLIALGTAIKLWPVLLIPAVAAPSRARTKALVGTVGTGIIVVAASLWVGGFDRLLSPLAYQTDRGLQIESLPALPLMLVWSVIHQPWSIVFSQYITNEIRGPATGLFIQAATLATALALLLIAILWFRSWRRGPLLSAADVGWLMLTITGLFIVTNKVFSPQYLLWLIPVAVATISCTPADDLRIRRWTVILIGVAVVTHLIYPNLYFLVGGESPFNPIGVLLLALRDAGLVGLTYYAVNFCWRRTRAVS